MKTEILFPKIFGENDLLLPLSQMTLVSSKYTLLAEDYHFPFLMVKGIYYPDYKDRMDMLTSTISTSAPNDTIFVFDVDVCTHFSKLNEMWQLLFEFSFQRHTQLIASTSSRDCIMSFLNISNQYVKMTSQYTRIGTSVRNSDYGNIIATTLQNKDWTFDLL